jgi:hypothetical protein
MKDFIVSVFVAYYVVALLVAPWLDRRENRNRSGRSWSWRWSKWEWRLVGLPMSLAVIAILIVGVVRLVWGIFTHVKIH